VQKLLQESFFKQVNWLIRKVGNGQNIDVTGNQHTYPLQTLPLSRQQELVVAGKVG